MKIAVIDADLIGRKRHRFPNLACMKISGYHKGLSDTVTLKLNYDGLDDFDRVYISKVFTDTPVPEDALTLPNVSYGGTGFFYDKAPPLPDGIEHHFPDYHLYDEWLKTQNGNTQYYTDYSIGFLTRGCFRQCPFCVNRNYKQVQKHSPLAEFLDESRPKICLLDDNFLGHPDWREMLEELQATGKPFIFKQGLDERILTPEKCEVLFKSRYAGDFGFAFDNITDAPLIEKKLQLLRHYTNKIPKFFCFTGFDRNKQWDAEFWQQDIFDLLERIRILMNYRCLPYIMRYARYTESPYARLYTQIARWCNQPQFFKKKSLREFGILNGGNSACYKAIAEFEKLFPEAASYFDMRYEQLSETTLAICG